MGYSIAVHAKSKKLRDKMFDFLKKNYKRADKLFPYQAYSCLATDLAYDDNPLAIGFDYNASGAERYYIFAITKWMATKITNPDKKGKYYYWYDEDERCNVEFPFYRILGDIDNVSNKKYRERFKREHKEWFDIIAGELAYLDTLWMIENG